MRSPDTTPSTASDLPGALCPQTDPEVFFPEIGASPKNAKRVCAACPVQADCLDLALSLGTVMGVWGGTTENERRQLKRHRPHICRSCGTEFTPTTRAAAYCSDLCRQRGRHATQAAHDARRTRRTDTTPRRAA